MDKSPYDLKVTDLDWIRENIKCMAGCPVNTYAGGHYGYIGLITQGRYEEAYQVARYPNPFPVACGYTCGAPCQTTCRRKDFDQPLAIRDLKRFLVDTHYAEHGGFELDHPVAPKTRARVAIVGAGPAGLTCATDLAELGYQCTVFDALPLAGGMMRFGVPGYRYPRDLLAKEVDALVARGIELRLNTRIGRDVMLADLRREYAAVVLAIGFQGSRNLPIPGHEAAGIHGGVVYLREQNLGNDQRSLVEGKRVLVIGGGNVAFDVARTSVRLGAGHVAMSALESWDTMPADEEEKVEGVREGIEVHNSRGPKEFVVEGGQVRGLIVRKVASVFDKDGRFNPSFIDGSEQVIPADVVFVAIGQTCDLSLLAGCDDVTVGPRGVPELDPKTQMTTAPGVFAAGDLETGPKLIITSIASGHRAADQIDRYLNGGVPTVEPTRYKFGLATVNHYTAPAPDYEVRPQVHMPLVELAIAKTSLTEQAHLGYDEAMAVKEAERCLWCDINTPIDDQECILCNGCVDVCPYNTLHMVDLKRVQPETEAARAIEQKLGMPFDQALSLLDAQGLDFDGTLMIKDERLCIRCGLCAMRCPTGAIRMEHLLQEETPQYAY